MRTYHVFEASRLERDGEVYFHARIDGRDCFVVFFDPKAGAGSSARLKGEVSGIQAGTLGLRICGATYENVLIYEREISPRRRLVPLHTAGYQSTMGMGNRLVVANCDRVDDVPTLRDPSCLAGFGSSYQSTVGTGIPSWFIQQSIARELLPEGVSAEDHPGIGHTGGYGPRELLRAGLFAFGAQGGYTDSGFDIGADADHAIISGRNEDEIAASLELNKLAMAESREYTKFTVDTSQLFGYPAEIGEASLRQLRSTFRGRKFEVPNVNPGEPDYTFAFSDERLLELGRKYWRPLKIHRELYDYCLELKGDTPFDYELSLDETPAPAPADELLFYLVALEEMFGIPRGRVSAAGPNIGYFKRGDYKGDVEKDLYPLANACASIMAARGTAFSVHSGDGASPFSGRGPAVDIVVGKATGRKMELKLSDIYQEIPLARDGLLGPPERARSLRVGLGGHPSGDGHPRQGLRGARRRQEPRGERAAVPRQRGAGEGRRGFRHTRGWHQAHQGRAPLRTSPAQVRPPLPRPRRPGEPPADRRVLPAVRPVRLPEGPGPIYQTLSAATWDDFDARCRAYTHMRMRDLGFIK